MREQLRFRGVKPPLPGGAIPAPAPTEAGDPPRRAVGVEGQASPAGAASVSRNVPWTLLGSGASAAGSWLVVIVLARAAGAAEVGSYALALALTAPVMAFAGLQLRSLLASDPGGRFAFREYRRLALLTTGAGVLACVLLGFTAEGTTWRVLLAVFAMRAADGISEIYWGLWQQRERMSVIGIGRLLQAAVSVGLVSALARRGGAVAAATGAAAGSLVLLGFLIVRTTADPEMRHALPARGAGSVSWRRLGSLAWQGLPLGVILLLGALQVNVPRYFVQRDTGKAVLGLFAAASQLTTSGQLFVGALGSAALPRLAAWHAAGDPAFHALARRMTLAGVLLGVAGVLAAALVGRPVLEILYGPEFGAGASLLLVLSVAAGLGFVGSFLGYALTAARVIAVQPVLLLAALGVTAAACAVLSPRLGAAGAAWALVAGAAVQTAASEVALRRRPVRKQR